MLEKILHFLSKINNHLNYENAYQNYLKQTKLTNKSICEHQSHKKLDRKEFFKLYHCKKWQKINRCC